MEPFHLLSYRSTKAFMVQRLEAEGAEVVLKFFESFSVDGVELGSASRTNNYSFVFEIFCHFPCFWDQIF